MIKIECQCADSLSLDELTEFQGNLKKRTKADIEKIKNLIIKYGFSFPFFVWKSKGKNFTLDGHGRILALRELRETEKDFPEAFPVVYVNAKNEAEAKKKVLSASSTFGKMTSESVIEFAGSIELSEFSLSGCEDMEFSTSDDAERKPKMESSFNYHEQFGVIVVCESEAHQEKIYERLRAEGLNVKVVKV